MLPLCFRCVSLPPNGLWVFDHRDLCKVNYSKTQSCCLQIEEKRHVGKLKTSTWAKNLWLILILHPMEKRRKKRRKITIWERKKTKTGSESSSEFWGKSESEWQHSGSDGCYSRHTGCLRIWSQNTRNNIKAKFRLCSIWVNELIRFPSPDLLCFF